MLAMADKYGRVWGSIPGLANRARVDLPECEIALTCFLSPDPYSRTGELEGRRIEKMDGGWKLLNYDKFRSVRDEEQRKEYKKLKQREYRGHLVDKNIDSGHSVDKVDSCAHNAEAEAEAELKTNVKALRDTRARESVIRVWDFYLSTFKKNPLANDFSDKRKQKGKTCFIHCLKLMEGSYEDAESLMKEAVMGLSKNRFFVENGFVSWEKHIFSSVEKMEERWQDFRKGR
jgi:hypothetical protein